MPPAIPVYALDSTERKRSGVNKTRAGIYFAEVSFPSNSEPHMKEFGPKIYGPPRSTEAEAKADLHVINQAKTSGIVALRRLIARIGALGGTKSSPSSSVTPVMKSNPQIRISFPGNDGVLIRGVRRPNVSVLVSRTSPLFLMARIIDVLSDVLACVVDSQLGISPPTSDLVEIVKFAISRERAECPISDTVLTSEIIPLIELMKLTTPWALLQPPRPETDDEDVIRGLLHQLFDKCRKADIFGEKKQLKRLRKEVRDRKKTAHTLFVSNLPKEVAQESLFELFNTGIEGLNNPIYRVMFPNETKSYAFVTCRSRKATYAILQKKDWIMKGKKLYVAPREEGDESPSAKRQRTGSDDLTHAPPDEISSILTNLVAQHPGCNLSQIPELLKKMSPEVKVDPHQMGFKSLAHLMQGIPDIHLERSKIEGSFRPAYHAFPKNS
jgi:hypothetical protein